MKRIHYALLLLLSGFIHPDKIGYATTTKLQETKKQLQQLDIKITQLNKNLKQTHHKHTLLDKELAATEKNIGLCVRNLYHIQQELNQNNQNIKKIECEIDALNEQIQSHQLYLAEHIRALHRMGQHQPLKWLLDLQNYQSLNRLLTYYHYVIQSRQKSIEHIRTLQNQVTVSKEALAHKIDKQQALVAQLKVRQATLAQEKRYHQQIIKKLDEDIQNKQQTLAEFNKNKTELAQLIHTLSRQTNVSHLIWPSRQKHQKISYPLLVPKKNIKKINQGLFFEAKEGAPIAAVSSGKVVFSDWLKGYGLLLIIDHGRGFMTLYAHNQSLFKQKGEIVQEGDTIAKVGHSGGLKKNGLYFEIRQRGKAISPQEWLS